MFKYCQGLYIHKAMYLKISHYNYVFKYMTTSFYKIHNLLHLWVHSKIGNLKNYQNDLGITMRY